MSHELPPLAPAQLEIMNVVWDLGRCTVAEVLQRLSERRPITRNTVQTMLSRLDERGWLTHRKEAGRFVYSPAVPRKQVQSQYLTQVVDSVFDGSAEGLLLTLLQNRTLSKEEATRIRRMIKDAEASS